MHRYSCRIGAIAVPSGVRAAAVCAKDKVLQRESRKPDYLQVSRKVSLICMVKTVDQYRYNYNNYPSLIILLLNYYLKQ